jgi:hypothetical protein
MECRSPASPQKHVKPFEIAQAGGANTAPTPTKPVTRRSRVTIASLKSPEVRLRCRISHGLALRATHPKAVLRSERNQRQIFAFSFSTRDETNGVDTLDGAPTKLM